MSSLDRVHMRRGDVSKKNYDLSPVIRWCQLSRSTACKNGNIAFAYSFHFSCKSCVKRCNTQCKWNDLKLIEWCKCSNTIEWATPNVSAIEQADSKGDLFNMAKFLASRSSRVGLPVRISSWKSWQSSPTSAIQNLTVRSAEVCSPNCACSLSAICLQYHKHRFPHSRKVGWSFSDHTPSETYS
jgi:hypothetical protein